MEAPSHNVALLPTSDGSERLWDAEAFVSGFDDDSYLQGARTVAGALLALALAAMLITSLVGASTVAWTVLLTVVAAGLMVVKRMPTVRHRSDRRLPTDP